MRTLILTACGVALLGLLGMACTPQLRATEDPNAPGKAPYLADNPPALWVDPATGCHYFRTGGYSSWTVRVDRRGQPYCPTKEPTDEPAKP